MGVRSYLTRHARQVLGGYVPRERKIAFIHVPKCGGTSLDRAIEAAMAPPLPRPLPLVSRLDDQAAERARRLRGASYVEARADALLYELGREGIRYVSGHHPLSDLAYREFHSEWDFLTLLRDPVERWLSHYFHNRAEKRGYFRIDEDLDDFLESPRARGLGANFVRMLAPDAAWPGDAPSAEAVDAAVSNLGRFAIAGVLERLDHFVDQFRRRYGARLFVGRLNTNPFRQEGEREVSAAQRERVAELCTPNLVVYRAALERIAREAAGP